MLRHDLASPAAQVLPIEVVGFDLNGKQYIAHGHTLTITRGGATILLSLMLAPESELVVRNLLTGKEAVARIVGHIREDASGHVYGIAFVDPAADLWGDLLPSTDSHQDTVMECSHCHTVRAVTLTAIEMEIFESKRALTLPCECSHSSTIWKQTTQGVSVEKKKRAGVRDILPEPVAPFVERRGDRRTAMTLSACIRYSGQEEIVACEDVSRGGFRFRCWKQYTESTRIEAAILFERSSANIFVPARIVYHQKLPDGSHRHGVTYLKTSRKTDQDE